MSADTNADAETDVDYDFDYDVLVIGSGFGGSVTALRLTEKGYRVGVLEAGARFDESSYPATSWDVRKFLFAPAIGCYGIQRIDVLKDCLIMSGAGVGGGSLVYANTLYEPLDAFYTDPSWSSITDWRAELAPYFDQAKRMLGVVTNPTMSPSDEVMRTVADEMGVGDTFRLTPVGVYFGAPGSDRAGPVLRRRRPRTDGLPRVWRVHDGLPAQREEHPAEELPLPRRTGRRRRASAHHRHLRRTAVQAAGTTSRRCRPSAKAATRLAGERPDGASRSSSPPLPSGRSGCCTGCATRGRSHACRRGSAS